jgi:hypothetical protein
LERLLAKIVEQDPVLNNITVTAMDPGGLVDSRAHKEQRLLAKTIFSVLKLLLPVMKYVTSDLRSSSEAGRDLLELSIGPNFAGRRGYLLG